MGLTTQELDIFPSVVAIVAIAGTLVGVRLNNKSTLKAVALANENALKIAEAERSSKREDELLALKRTMYAKLLSELNALVKTSLIISASGALPTAQKATLAAQRINVAMTAANSLADVSLITPPYINAIATEAFTVALNASADDVTLYVREAAKLRAMMQTDLRGDQFRSPEELEKMADIAFARDTSVPLYVDAFKTTVKSPETRAEDQQA